MDMEDVDKLLEEAAEMAERKTEEERIKREGTDESSRPGSRRSNDSRRRSRSPRRDRDRDSYRRRDDDHYRPGGRVSDEDQFYRPGRRDDRARGSDERSRAHDRRDRDRDHDRGHDRDRRDRRDRDRERDRERGDRDRGGRDRDRDRDGKTRDHGRKPSRTPELNDDERDARTVFVQQLAARLRTKELSAFFASCGTVKEAQIVKDRISGRSKGVGYVEFKEEASVEKALQLTGQKLLGIPVIVQMTEAEKNRQVKTNDGPNPQNAGVPFHRLYVGNIHFSITEEDLRNVFEPFGELEFVQLQKEEQGRSKGYGFVQYRDPDAAKEALEKMNGFDLANRPIRVGLGNDRFTNESTQNLLQRFPEKQQGSGVFGAGGRGTHAGGDVSYESKGRHNDRGGIGNASALNDTDVGESNLANISRHEIMQKLLRRDDGAAASNGTTEKVKPVRAAPPKPQAPQVTRCVVLSNVYDLAEEEQSGGNWKDDLLADIKGECDRKFGRVVHIDTDPNTTEVFIKFSSVDGASNAVQGLNGRHFGGRQIAASPLIEAVYNAQWRQAIDL